MRQELARSTPLQIDAKHPYRHPHLIRIEGRSGPPVDPRGEVELETPPLEDPAAASAAAAADMAYTRRDKRGISGDNWA